VISSSFFDISGFPMVHDGSDVALPFLFDSTAVPEISQSAARTGPIVLRFTFILKATSMRCEAGAN
jgi:hypothetical protein